MKSASYLGSRFHFFYVLLGGVILFLTQMDRRSWAVFCLAYIVGLLSASFVSSQFSEQIAVEIALVGWLIVATFIALRFNYLKVDRRIWLGAGLVAILAVVYFQFRIPQLRADDVSYQVKETSSSLVFTAGQVLTEPRLTQNQRIKFWLQAKQVRLLNKEEDNATAKAVSGKLYVTVPLLQGTNIYPGKYLNVKGILYKPKSPNTPGAFDFSAYLARRGAFAGLKGLSVTTNENQPEPAWGLWKLRRRIVRSQMRWLGSPTGQLVSSMVLGRRAVDLPEDVRDRFIKAGLAHILAASGFHVSLLLGMTLRLTSRLSPQSQLLIGFGTLATYISLAGLQASVLRAALMGTGVLIALVLDTKVRPLGSLLLAATIILLVDPLLIEDLGFQLSFLATLGLIVTAPALSQRLDWLPPTIATIFAIPLAASLWTLPLLIYSFNTVATYSILVNIISTPLVTLISLGGMISAIAALIIPVAGSAIAWLLLYPTLLLDGITKFFNHLPGSSLAIGKISLGLLIVVYGLICLVWLNKWWQHRWWLAMAVAIILVIAPVSYGRFNLIQVTVLATNREPVIVIQDRGKVILINSGEGNTAKYKILPFFAEQGINQIDYGIAWEKKSKLSSGWSEIEAHVSIKQFISNSPGNSVFGNHQTQLLSQTQTILTDSTQLKLVSIQPIALQLQIQDWQWLILDNLEKTECKNQVSACESVQTSLQSSFLEVNPQVLLWSGNNLATEWLSVLFPQVAIATTNNLEEDIRLWLKQKQIKLYSTGLHGTIRWTPPTGFESILVPSQSSVF